MENCEDFQGQAALDDVDEENFVLRKGPKTFLGGDEDVNVDVFYKGLKVTGDVKGLENGVAGNGVNFNMEENQSIDEICVKGVEKVFETVYGTVDGRVLQAN